MDAKSYLGMVNVCVCIFFSHCGRKEEQERDREKCSSKRMIKQENHSAFEYAALIGSVYDGLHSESFSFLMIFINLLRRSVQKINPFLKKFRRHSHIRSEIVEMMKNKTATKRQCTYTLTHTYYAQYDNKSTASLHKRCIHRLSAANLLIFFFFITFISIFCRSQFFFSFNLFFSCVLSLRETRKKERKRKKNAQTEKNRFFVYDFNNQTIRNN